MDTNQNSTNKDKNDEDDVVFKFTPFENNLRKSSILLLLNFLQK